MQDELSIVKEELVLKGLIFLRACETLHEILGRNRRDTIQGNLLFESFRMKRLPKLRVEGLGWDTTNEMCDFDQARYFPYESRDLVIVVEGEVVRSYEDVEALAEHNKHKQKEVLSVKFLPVIAGG
jgi:hypothetical protein